MISVKDLTQLLTFIQDNSTKGVFFALTVLDEKANIVLQVASGSLPRHYVQESYNNARTALYMRLHTQHIFRLGIKHLGTRTPSWFTNTPGGIVLGSSVIGTKLGALGVSTQALCDEHLLALECARYISGYEPRDAVRDYQTLLLIGR